VSKHTIIGVIILMSISLLGVVGLQLYWINDAIKVKQEQFDRSVNAALTKVVEKIETHEAVSVVAHQMAALKHSTPVPPPVTTQAPPTAYEVSSLAPPQTAKQAEEPVESGTEAQPRHSKASVSLSSDPKVKPAQQPINRGVATAHGSAPADYIYIAPAGNVSAQYSRAESIPRKKSLKEKDKVMAATLATAAIPATGPYLNLIRNIPDSLHLRHPQGNILDVNRLLRSGNGHQLEVAQELRELSDSAVTLFRMRQGEPIRISVDTLRHLAVELENLREMKVLPITVRPSVVSSVDVRHDSIIIYRTDTARQTHFRRQATNGSGKAASLGTLYTQVAPLGNTTAHAGTSTQKEIKVAKPTKVISGGENTAAASPSKLPNAKTNASNIEKIDIKKDKLNDVVQKMVVEYAVRDEPLQQRLDLHGLQQLLKSELQQQGIQLDFGYWVVSGKTDTVVAQNLTAISNRALPSYKATLFPNDIFDKPDYLGLYFPDSKTYALKSLWGMLSLSALFTLVIIATFGTTIHIIYKQKKLSEMKNDFINNMTHEFKTPIATISLATDSITNPKVYENPDRIKYYTGIIREENKRMNAQVENVLQIAQLEKNEFRMNLQPIDVHALIIKAIEGIRLQVEQRLGHINVQLEALEHELHSDEVHLYNVICNLLDNANKYSPASPDIHLVTKNVNGGIVIAVEDKGIGMSKDTQQRVFEKFYRVPTGNLHNVKGFGLGLSYVKAIVQAHRGDIKLKSELGKGSRFEIFLPFA
jgi:signal transduction histidine kinase